MSEQEKIIAKPINDLVKYDGPVEYVDVTELVPFNGKIASNENGKDAVKVENPFSVPDDTDKDMLDLRKGIEEYGIMVPLIVRKKDNGKYELLSGYRRKRAVEVINESRSEANKMRVPIIEVPNCGDDQAIEILTTSNTHRKKITLREQIKACGLAYRAMRRKNRYSKDTEGRAADVVGKMFNANAKQVQRYSALLNLNDNLLKFIGKEDVTVDEDGEEKKIHYKTTDGKLKLSRRAGEILSTLNKEQQEIIFQFLKSDVASISISEAVLIRNNFRANPELTLEEFESIARGWKKASKVSSNFENKDDKVDLDDLQSYVPNKTPQEIREGIYLFLNQWREAGGPEKFEIKALDD